MPIIDLETGKIQSDVVQPPTQQPESAQAPQPVQQGGIIDLDSGQFINQQRQFTPQQPVQQPQPEEGGLFETVTEPLTAIVGGAATDVAAGLRGLGGLLFGESLEDAAGATEEIKQELGEFFAPDTESGKQALATLGGFIQKGVDIARIPLSGLAGLVELGTGQGVEQAAQTISDVQEKGLSGTFGDRVFEESDSPLLATIATVIPDAAVELTALKGFKKTRASKPESISKRVQSEAERASASKAQAATEATGIDLFQAQKTLNPTDIEKQAFVAQLPEGASNARNALIKQNKQAADAVDSILNQLAPAEVVGAAPARFRTAAQEAIEVQKNIRRQKASPLYNEAFDVGADVNVNTVRESIQSKLEDLPETGEISKQLRKVNSLLKGKGDKAPTLKRLHNSKLEIDQMIEKVGEGSLGNTTKRELIDIQKQLVDEINTASPLYKQAGEEFAKASEPLNRLIDSPVGRISKLDDVQLKQVSSLIFDPATNPSVIAKAKKTITDVDPNAWNAMVRTELEKRLGKVRADIGDLSDTAALENIPSQLFNSVFGNKKNRDVLFSSVDGETKKNLKYLETALKRATKGRPGGSQTAIRQDIRRSLQGGIYQGLRDFFKKPIETVAGIGEEVSFDKKVRALSEAMFDPTWKDDMKELRNLPPASTKAKRILENVLNSALVTLPTIEEQEQ